MLSLVSAHHEDIMRQTFLALVAFLTALGTFGGDRFANANERHFAFTYETATLPEGHFELEPWFTFRTGKERFFNRFDQRLELEYGVTDTVTTALYLNYSASAFKDGTDVVKELGTPGMSWEWKFKLADPVADPIGVGLYFEVGAKPHEAEFEFKLLLDKQIGDVLVALNAVVESEFELDETEVELLLELDLAAAWLISTHFSLGVEVRGVLVMPEVESVEHGALYAGLTLGYRTERFWLALSILPQVAALAGATGDSSLNLTEFERVQSRLIAGYSL
ncbi:MAG: hypothetical protein CVU56_04935 [Deltaproteobacteria bacterium HGW-Deltaproteobacteria-14]|jgi:hypothetical protein|nr:MAG: hypothetical protein CVU56_04935 [Deltaproteobacteria bacterium HGW-Deltaproteobacteria-14]